MTIPTKVAVTRHLDDLEESAATIGAVNTVVNHNGRLVGHNTDGTGALAALRESGVEPSGKRVLLLGSGGAARALAFTMAETVENLTILNRTISKARTLAEEIRRVTTMSVTGGGACIHAEECGCSSNMVCAMSIGMNPNAGGFNRQSYQTDMIV
jgi:shikimate dehydrogenase